VARSERENPSWEVVFSPDAAADLARHVPRRDAERIISAIQRVALDPFAPNSKLTALQGEPGLYRLRQGDWRVV
jgi:mRNA interferase RelE/StbE